MLGELDLESWGVGETWGVDHQRLARGAIRNLSYFALACLVVLTPPLVAADRRATQNTIPQVELINNALQSQWDAYGLTPAPDEEDQKWCRRVFLDLIGRIPSRGETQEFVADKGDRRRNLVVRLLNDDEYAAEFANHWATIWSNLLIGRSGGNDRNSMVSRAGMNKYLRDSFATNKPYNQMVFELLTASGTTEPGTDDFNGATNFLIDKVNMENGTLATSSTSRIFLGLQVQCTQCHNHPFNEWKQQKFWEFNAFFRQTRAASQICPRN